MVDNCIAIITARGGSKRIPGKNARNFLGQPIINYPVYAALQARCFDDVMVSTDDSSIKKIAEDAGATVPFMRSDNNSNDEATTTDVLLEVIENYKSAGKTFTYGCCIYPTAVFVTAEKLRAAYQKFIDSGADSLVPVVRYGFPIQRSMKIQEGLLRMNWPEHLSTRSQDLPPAYHDRGQFYFFKVASLIEKRPLFTDFTIPFEISEMVE